MTSYSRFCWFSFEQQLFVITRVFQTDCLTYTGFKQRTERAWVDRMRLNNTTSSYGWVSIILHWLLALVLLGLFFSGVWMVDLDYYSTWYHQAPWIHKSIGVLAVSLMLFRLVWNIKNKTPQGLDSPALNRVAHAVHHTLYLLVIVLGVSGYLIATAEGDSISVFDWFEVQALITPFEGQADLAGWLHEWLAYSLIALVVLHVLAALKHHFFTQDLTLKRMLKPQK